MSHNCLDLERLAEVEAWPPDDPRRSEFESCPRCASQLAAYRAFVRPPGSLPGERPEHARAVLRESLLGALGPARDVMPAARPASAHRFPFKRWFSAPAALTVAGAALLLVAIFGTPWRSMLPSRSGVVRGDRSAGGPAPTETPGVPAVSKDGGLVFAWRSVGGADSYRLRIFTADLRQIVARVIRSDTTTTVTHAELATATGDLLYWDVTAIAEERELSVSQPVAFRAP